mmetsp:Transcript_7942/g.19764  ORF Transcript_7942/g.19764 Transcript_7942/m.19764 type:complete len:219 (-) Transcript_7942:963-1619(-)
MHRRGDRLFGLPAAERRRDPLLLPGPHPDPVARSRFDGPGAHRQPDPAGQGRRRRRRRRRRARLPARGGPLPGGVPVRSAGRRLRDGEGLGRSPGRVPLLVGPERRRDRREPGIDDGRGQRSDGRGAFGCGRGSHGLRQGQGRERRSHRIAERLREIPGVSRSRQAAGHDAVGGIDGLPPSGRQQGAARRARGGLLPEAIDRRLRGHHRAGVRKRKRE